MGSPTKTVSYRYDSRGNRSALINHDGGRTSYTYDVMNRLTQVIDPQGERTSYSYDAAGRRTVKKLANGTRASFTYDAAGNLTKLANLKSDGTTISSFDYTYDKVGNRKAVQEADGSRVTWSYDDAYQLTGEHRTGSNAYRDTYTYDPAGNRLLKNHDGARTTYAYDAANQLTYSQDAGGRTTFTYDADGNQQVVREPSGNRTTYAWDYENRMTQAQLPGGVRNTMAYDADGLRVKLDESTGTKKFVWDDQNYLGETDAANDTQVIYTNEPLVYGNLVSQRRASTSHWYHFDAIGSTRELTDASEIVTDTRLYDAWGNPIASSGSTISPLRWVGGVGYYFDSEFGMYYVRARVYQPTIASWVSIDPIWSISPQVHLYDYVSNHPLARIDPMGLQADEPDTGFCCIFSGRGQSLGRRKQPGSNYIEVPYWGPLDIPQGYLPKVICEYVNRWQFGGRLTCVGSRKLKPGDTCGATSDAPDSIVVHPYPPAKGCAGGCLRLDAAKLLSCNIDEVDKSENCPRLIKVMARGQRVCDEIQKTLGSGKPFGSDTCSALPDCPPCHCGDKVHFDGKIVTIPLDETPIPLDPNKFIIPVPSDCILKVTGTLVLEVGKGWIGRCVP